MTLIKGDKHKSEVEVLKIRKDIPTVIKVGGHRYVLEHPNQFKRGVEK